MMASAASPRSESKRAKRGFPGGGHLDRHEARVGREHQREPDVVLAQHARVVALLLPRQQVEVTSGLELDAAPRVDRADAVQLPSPERTTGDGAVQGEDPQLEHVPGRVWLWACIEEKLACPPALQLARLGRVDRSDCALK